MPALSKNLQRVRRHARLRRKVIGTAERPRLQIHRTLHHIYAAVIDDARGSGRVGWHNLRWLRRRLCLCA